MKTFYNDYKFLIVPIVMWLGIQLFKVIYDFNKTKKWNFRRIWGAGGMPSSHSAVVVSLATLMGKYEGVNSSLFAISAVLALVVMYDAAGVRRAVGKQAHILNDILMNQETTGVEKLQEMTGHTPFQVLAGAILGFIAGVIC